MPAGRPALEELLGTIVLEALELRAARLMATALSLQAVNLLCALARLLPERRPRPSFTTSLADYSRSMRRPLHRAGRHRAFRARRPA